MSSSTFLGQKTRERSRKPPNINTKIALVLASPVGTCLLESGCGEVRDAAEDR